MRPWHKWILFVCLGFMGLGGRAGGRLNIMIIGLDTLRRDHLGCYGYYRNTSPNIDEFAASGVLCENAVSQAPWTLPAFATVFTSLYPTQHGATSRETRMGTTFPTLVTILKGKGYATCGIVNAPLLRPIYGMGRGFDHYQPRKGGRVADGTTMDALDWIDLNRDLPFFIFVHYFDPHLPYSPPAPYDTLFASRYNGRIGKSYTPENTEIDRSGGFAKMRALKPEDWNQIKALYDGEIAFADEAIGRLLDGLEDRGLRHKTLVVFLSDHGEEFLDHGGFEHGHTLYDEMLKVPLVFSLPGVIPRSVRIPDQVRLLDLAPTILDLVGISSDTHFEGVSLKPLLLVGNGKVRASESGLLRPEVSYSENLLYFRRNEKKCLTVYPWKLIYDMRTGEKQFFNLAEDPGEKVNLAGMPPDSMAVLEEILLKTLFAISDTWFVEIAGGKVKHVIDLELRSKTSDGSTRFALTKMSDGDQHIWDLTELPGAEATATRIKIKGLRTEDPITVAFKLEREDGPVELTCMVDGRPAVEHVFLGKSLKRAQTMPLIITSSPGGQADQGPPVLRPEPPYVLIWSSENRYGQDTSIDLNEGIKKQLRAVGYFQ